METYTVQTKVSDASVHGNVTSQTVSHSKDNHLNPTAINTNNYLVLRSLYLPDQTSNIADNYQRRCPHRQWRGATALRRRRLLLRILSGIGPRLAGDQFRYFLRGLLAHLVARRIELGSTPASAGRFIRLANAAAGAQCICAIVWPPPRAEGGGAAGATQTCQWWDGMHARGRRLDIGAGHQNQ